jgi:peptide/nickel transport system ATP-binding protein
METTMKSTSDPVLRYRSFGVTFRTDSGVVDAVRDVDLEVRPGETLALVGESASGKTVTSLAALGLLPANATPRGSVTVAGTDVLGASALELRRMRSSVVSMVFQEPSTALNPLMRIGAQIEEAMPMSVSRKDRRARAVELLRQVGLPEPERRLRSYPHEMSGGQRQRVVIAMALASDPVLIVADEPTTALDVTVQAEILELLRVIQRERNVAMLLVTHSMGVVADIADRVAVMFRGDLVETGTCEQVLTAPAHEYTASLLQAVPALPRLDSPESRAQVGTSRTVDAPIEGERESVLSIEDLVVEFGSRHAPVRAVDGFSMSISRGEFVGLVGESGSGKSTVGRCALGLLAATKGAVRLFGQNPSALTRKEHLALRRRIGVVLQDPVASLDPRMSIAECIEEPMIVHSSHSRLQRRERIEELLDAVRLPREAGRRYPHELSGGQRQRVSLARALALDPELLLADEPTSALDVLVQANVLDVIAELQGRYGFACLFISHDLAVVDQLTDNLLVMRYGQLVESGPTTHVLRHPREEYTRSLLAAAPVPNPVEQRQRRELWFENRGRLVEAPA